MLDKNLCLLSTFKTQMLKDIYRYTKVY